MPPKGFPATKPVTCSLHDLEALRCPSIEVFKCAHHWVTDESIREAMLHGSFDDPAVPWTEKTNRAERIASIAVMMLAGIEFPALWAHCTVLQTKTVWRGRFGRKTVLELRDGHHRLRALQYLGRTQRVRFNVSGSYSILRQKLVDNKPMMDYSEALAHMTEASNA